MILLFLFQCAVKNLRNVFKMNATEKICSLFWLKASNCQYAVFNFHLAFAFYFFLLFCVFLLASAFGTVSHLRAHTRTQSRIAIGFVFRFTEDLKTNAISRIRMRIRESRTIRTRHDMARYGMITARYVAPQAFASQLSDSL